MIEPFRNGTICRRPQRLPPRLFQGLNERGSGTGLETGPGAQPQRYLTAKACMVVAERAACGAGP